MSDNNIIEKRTIDGGYERFDITRVFDFLNQSKNRIYQKDCKHNIVGKTFRSIKTNKIITFTKVIKDWYGGFYYMGLYVDDRGSHGMIYFENINCIHPVIIDGISDFNQNFIDITTIKENDNESI